MSRAPLLFLVAFSFAAYAQQPPPSPVIGPFGVLHGASQQPVRILPDLVSPAGIAPGSIFLLKGGYLGPDEVLVGTAPFGIRLPDVAGGTEVRVRSLETGEVRQAPVVHAWNFQVAAILPEDFPLGEAEAQVWYRGQASRAVSFPIVRSFPGLFTVGQNGAGRGVIQNYIAPGEVELNGLTHSARPGQYVTLWGTGLGDATTAEVEASINGRPFPVAYAGPAPGLPGVDQVNLQLPADLTGTGCYVQLGLASRGISSGQVSVSVSPDGGVCTHPWGLSPERLAEIEAGDRATWVRAELTEAHSEDTTQPTLPPSASSAVAYALSLDEIGLEASNFQRFSNNLIPASRLSCSMVGISGVVGSLIWGDFSDPIPVPPEPENPPMRTADAGEPWIFTGPSGQSIELTRQPAAPQPSGILGPVQFEPGFLAPGEWRLRVPGGTEIPAFETTLQMPELPDVTAPTVIRRDQVFELTWPTTQFANTPAQADLLFRVPVEGQPGATFSVGFLCPVMISRGRAEIPMPELQHPLEGIESGTLTFRVNWRSAAGDIPGIDRLDLSGTAARSWTIPLE